MNGIQITSMLTRIQLIAETFDPKDFLEDIGLEDEDNEGIISFEKIQRIGRIDNLPKLDNEMWDFLKYIALRHSANLNEVCYRDFVQVLEEDYQIS